MHQRRGRLVLFGKATQLISDDAELDSRCIRSVGDPKDTDSVISSARAMDLWSLGPDPETDVSSAYICLMKITTS